MRKRQNRIVKTLQQKKSVVWTPNVKKQRLKHKKSGNAIKVRFEKPLLW